MTSALHRDEQIESYLLGTMTEVERRRFEDELRNDDALAFEVDQHRKAHVVIDYALSRDLKTELDSIDRDSPTTRAKVRSINLRKLSIAASVLILFGIATWVWSNQQYGLDNLTANLLATTEVPNLRGDNIPENTIEQRLNRADIAFGNGDYREASRLYQDAKAENPLFAEKAEWNLLLCHAQTDQVAFESLLNKLVDKRDHLYHEDALQLQEKMAGFWFKLVN